MYLNFTLKTTARPVVLPNSSGSKFACQAFTSSPPFPWYMDYEESKNICESLKGPLKITFMINCPNYPTRTYLIFTVHLLKNSAPSYLSLLKNWAAQMLYMNELQETYFCFCIKDIYTNQAVSAHNSICISIRCALVVSYWIFQSLTGHIITLNTTFKKHLKA